MDIDLSIEKNEFQSLLNDILVDLKFEKVYDKETDTTDFQIIYPKWLFKKYNISVQNKVISVISPLVADIMRSDSNHSPFEIQVEPERVIRSPESTNTGGDKIQSANNGGDRKD